MANVNSKISASDASPKIFLEGAYRLHPKRDAEFYTSLAVGAFPDMETRINCFGSSWHGCLYATDQERIVRGEPQILLLEPGTGEALEIPVDLAAFHEIELIEESDAAVAYSFFKQWLGSGGALPTYSQCVGYRKPLFLGGVDETSNLEISDFNVYWTLTAQMLNKVRGLPMGTRIGNKPTLQLVPGLGRNPLLMEDRMFYADGYSEAFLESLSIQDCVWIALAAATRQSKNYMRLPPHHQALSDLDAFLAKAWEATFNGDVVSCKQAIEAAMSALPPEDDDNSYEVIVAENCLLSLIYALRCKTNGNKKEAHWALMKAYDAADQMALILWRAQVGDEYTEANIRAMPIVQRELANQAAAFKAVADVSDAKALAQLRAMSFASEFVTEDERNTLANQLFN